MGKGRKGAAPSHVDQLIAKGFSKTKATQALKDAGNSFAVALRILERQKEEQAAKEAKAAEKLSVSPRTAAEGKDDDATETEATARPVPLHPCVVQYKQCQYGDYCRLRYLPGDICINYYNGSCIYDDFCRRRHSVDGVDIREGQRPHISNVFTREDGTKYRIVSSGSRDVAVQLAERVEDEADDGGGGGGALGGNSFLYVPDASDFNLIRGSEPTHTDPLPDPGLRGGSTQGGSSTAVLPRPYLDKLVSASSRGGGAAALVCGQASGSGGGGGGSSSSALHAPSKTATVNGRRKHPCVAQCGSCKYGAACKHAGCDADVCVHFLNGHCRFSAEECRYRHGTGEEHVATLLGEEGDGGHWGAPRDSPPVAKPKRSRLLDRCGSQGALASRPVPGAAAALWHSAPISEATTSEGDSSPSYLEGAPVDSDVGDSRGAAWMRHSVRPPPPTAAQFFPPSNAERAEFDAGEDWTVSAHDSEPQSPGAAAYNPFLPDNELAVFLGLLEAFPQEEPAVILQALRSADGDPAAVADLIGRVEGTATADIDAELSKVLAEEEAAEAEADRRSRECVKKSETLMTLCYLFPALELNSIEAVYHSRGDSFEEAYEALLCSQENFTRSDYGNVWRGHVNPAEQLLLEKIKAMFSEIHPDIVRSTFGAADKDLKRTVAALNQLTSELLTLQTRVERAAAATRWRPHAYTAVDDGEPRLAARASPAPPVNHDPIDEGEARRLHKVAATELQNHGDWRRVRLRAYSVNECRLRVLSQASAAYLRGDGALAKALSREGYHLGCEYKRLNHLAMLALEMERLRADPATTLDLHGFHAAEALEVLTRRVDLCQRKHIRFLSIIVGEGRHSRRGGPTLSRVVTDFLETDPRMRAQIRLVSVLPGSLVVRLSFSGLS